MGPLLVNTDDWELLDVDFPCSFVENDRRAIHLPILALQGPITTSAIRRGDRLRHGEQIQSSGRRT